MTRRRDRSVDDETTRHPQSEGELPTGLRSHAVPVFLVLCIVAVATVGIWMTRSVAHDLTRLAIESTVSGQPATDPAQRVDLILLIVAVASIVLVAALVVHLKRRNAQARYFVGRLANRTNSFEGSPVALWEEDFSRVGEWMRSLRASGVTDLRVFLADRPEAVDHGVGLVRILAVNPAARRMIKSDATPFLFGPEPGAGLPEALRDSMVDQFDAIWRGEDRTVIEISGTRIDGSHLDVVLYWQAARTDAGGIDLTNVMVAMVDVTERVTAEVEMVRMIRMRDQLIATVSHELRTPLTSVIGLLEVLREMTTFDQSSEERTLLDLAAAEAESLGFLVEDLLVAARRDLGEVPVKAVPIPIGEIVHRTIERLSWSSAGEARFDIEVPGDLEAVGDPVRVGQILRNLLVNSIRYGGERRRVTVAADGPELVLRVIDDGPGVDPGMIGALFDPYRNAQMSPTLPGSLGLGLSISRTLAVAMGGDLSYYRRAGETVFELRLPAALSPVLRVIDGGSASQGASVPARYPWAGWAAASSGGWGSVCETFRDEGADGPVVDPFPVLDPTVEQESAVGA